MKKYCFYLIILLFGITACNNSPNIPDVSKIPMEVEIIRLEQELEKVKTPNDIPKMARKYPTYFLDYQKRSGVPPQVMISDFYQISQSPYIDTLTQTTNQYFGDMTDVKAEFEQSFRFVKHYFPDFEPPAVFTNVTGYGNDIFVSDSLLIVGLDFFLGKNSPYQPPNVPEYILQRLQKNYIVPTSCLFLSNKYNATMGKDGTTTMLDDMIYYGKSYQFVRMTNPHVPDSVITGYTHHQTQEVQGNASFLWAHFVEKDLFYEKSHLVKNKYLGESPFTHAISSECPGRIGRWLGWQIVQSYLKNNPEVTLSELMNNANAEEIFRKSKYRPNAEK